MIGIKLCLQVTQKVPMRISPMVGLSVLELELLLDQSLEQVKIFHEENPAWRTENPPEERGNYLFGRSFSQGCGSVKGKIPRQKYLETPDIFVEKRAEGYSARYNPQLEERIAQKLAQFKREEDEVVPADKIFSKQFARDRKWVVETQLAIAQYVCEKQNKYLETKNPLD